MHVPHDDAFIYLKTILFDEKPPYELGELLPSEYSIQKVIAIRELETTSHWVILVEIYDPGIERNNPDNETIKRLSE